MFITEKSESSRSGGCFDGNSVVVGRNGPKLIQQINIGDEILAVNSDGQLVFSEVLLFLDRDLSEPRLYYQIETESGANISLTPSHLIFVSDDLSAQNESVLTRVTFAKNVRIGQLLYTSTFGDNDSVAVPHLDRVVRVSTVVKSGAFAPLTREGNLIVNNVVASCYAVINSQDIAHWSFLPIRLFSNLYHSLRYIAYLLYARTHKSTSVSSSQQFGVHWYPKMLYSLSKHFIPASKMY